MKRILDTLFLCLSMSCAIAQAETDVWNGYFSQRGLFNPHSDYCDTSTEAFVQMGPNGDGYCIEKNERTGATWDEAKDTCASNNKRLPEPAEFRFACTRAGSLSLSNMTNNYEWVSNQSTTYFTGGSAGVMVLLLGSGGCGAQNIDGIDQTHVFRCVR